MPQYPDFLVHARISADDELIVAASDRRTAQKIADERRKEGYRKVWIVEGAAAVVLPKKLEAFKR